MSDWVIGLICSGVVAGAAYWKKSLSLSGMVAAVVMGTVYFAAGSLVWYGTLLAFFITSTVLSKLKKRAKAKYEAAYEKSGRRDAGQVLANGGIGMLLCIAYALWPHEVLLYGFIGVMATVTADTWATEVGSLSRRQPRSVITGKPIPTGTSGGVSMLGTLAAMAGGLFIGGCAAIGLVLAGGQESDWQEWAVWSRQIAWPIIGLVAGTLGAFADSLMGATCQVMYRCQTCCQTVERREHCGLPTSQIRGVRFLNNDRVNLFSSCIGGLAAIILGWAF